jgi:hypothetical protein
VPDEKVPTEGQKGEAGSRQYLEQLLEQCRRADYFPGSTDLIQQIEKALADMPPVQDSHSIGPPSAPRPDITDIPR